MKEGWCWAFGIWPSVFGKGKKVEGLISSEVGPGVAPEGRGYAAARMRKVEGLTNSEVGMRKVEKK